MPGFAAPWLLAGLALLPVLWWLIRRLPPPPRRVRLPTIRLLGAQPLRPSAARRPPWWLAVLRLGAVALVLLGLAGPEWRTAPAALPPGRIALVIDNGWAAAPAWPRLRDAADRYLAELPEGTRVALVPTAALPGGARPPVREVPPAAARAALAQLTPRPWAGDRAAAARAVPRGIALAWFADGIDSADAASLRRLGGAVAVEGGAGAAITGVRPDAAGWRVSIAASASAGPTAVIARDAAGREIGRAALPPGARELTLALPATARPARIDLDPAAGAAGAFLVAPGLARPRALLVDGEAAGGAPPLLRGATYVRRAVEPFASLRTGSAADAASADLLLLVDVALGPGPSADAALARVRSGGVAISFAGPRMAAGGSVLSPVPLNSAARSLGSVLAWDRPQPLGRVAADGPLAGLPPFPEALVRRQLVGGDAPGVMRWASLADGSPLVSARREGAGLLVLVHTAAGPEWSTLPLSGALQAMLRRLLPLAADPAATDIAGARPFALAAMLDADGALVLPPLAARLDAADLPRAVPSPLTPPGLWRSGELQRPLNLGGTLVTGDQAFAPLDVRGLAPIDGSAPPLRLGPPLIALGLLLVVVDGLLGALARRPFRLPWRAATATAAALLAAAPALGQGTQAPVALGFVTSGSAPADAAARAGLAALGIAVTQRTAIAVTSVDAVDPAAPGIGRYPLLYWRPSRPLTPAAAARLRGWLAAGGLLLIDPPPGGDAQSLRAALAPLDPPPLEPLTRAHVLTRSFYRLELSPGGIAPAPVWVEAGTRGGDGRIARMVLGSAGWPAAFASPDPQAREGALRFGVNLMLYALTGDYKADRVHSAPVPPS